MSDPRLDPPPGFLTRLVARAATALLPIGNRKPDPIRRILVVRTDDRVGNVLLTVPLVRVLQKNNPRSKVDLLVAARQARVVDGLPNLDVVRFDKRRPWRLPPRASYDVVIDAAHWHAFSLTSALVSRWAARDWLIGSRRGPAQIYSRAIPPPAEDVPEAAAKVALASLGLDIETDVPPLETALGLRPLDFVGLPPRFIALNPGARKEDHRWNDFRTLVTNLPLPCVVLWGPGEEELAREVGGQLAPKTDLDQLAAVFRRAAAVVTNDTGPMHLAVACGAPTVGLFLSKAGLRWAHPGPRFRAVLDPTVESVARAVRDLLDTTQQPADSREREGTP
jgi:ADP-heptose:LPS heptosyltransferase